MERPHSKEGLSLPAIANNSNTDERFSRMENLEDRLAVQERTTRSLVDRALSVKEDIIESLSIAQMSWQGEKRARSGHTASNYITSCSEQPSDNSIV